jgi:hypothetical protein
MQRLPVSSLTDPFEVRQTILNQNDKEKRRKESHNKGINSFISFER